MDLIRLSEKQINWMVEFRGFGALLWLRSFTPLNDFCFIFGLGRANAKMTDSMHSPIVPSTDRFYFFLYD